VAGALVVGLLVRGCHTGGRVDRLEQRVAHVETLLGIEDAGLMPSVDNVAARAEGGAPDDGTVSCALAKVAAYDAWQEANAKAKTITGPAKAACSEIWSDSKKQACYYAALANVRSTLAARDAVMGGPSASATEALKSVKDDPKNDAIGRARVASDKVFAVCPEVLP